MVLVIEVVAILSSSRVAKLLLGGSNFLIGLFLQCDFWMFFLENYLEVGILSCPIPLKKHFPAALFHLASFSYLQLRILTSTKCASLRGRRENLLKMLDPQLLTRTLCFDLSCKMGAHFLNPLLCNNFSSSIF